MGIRKIFGSLGMMGEDVVRLLSQGHHLLVHGASQSMARLPPWVEPGAGLSRHENRTSSTSGKSSHDRLRSVRVACVTVMRQDIMAQQHPSLRNHGNLY